MTLLPFLLHLPDGTRRRGAARACDWATAVDALWRRYPGASVQLTMSASPTPSKVTPVAALARA
jgi:hypothetical protein